MITMVDEIYDRHYREARSQLNASITDAFHQLSRSIGNAFEVLVNIEYQAPWATKAKRVRCN